MLFFFGLQYSGHFVTAKTLRLLQGNEGNEVDQKYKINLHQ